jgi:putative component of membrane protein insertase Oxa1/YidC/SpoIIIJ protein YidD
MTRRPGLPGRLALLAIRGYQRYLSPVKGFSCALRVATGGDSCSAYGYRAIRRGGLRVGLQLLRQRLRLCGHVHLRAPQVRHPLLHAQRGHCDLPGCDLPGCELPGCHLPSALDPACGILDAFSQCDCSAPWDWGRSRRRRQEIRARASDSAELDALAERIRARTRRD